MKDLEKINLASSGSRRVESLSPQAIKRSAEKLLVVNLRELKSLFSDPISSASGASRGVRTAKCRKASTIRLLLLHFLTGTLWLQHPTGRPANILHKVFLFMLVQQLSGSKFSRNFTFYGFCIIPSFRVYGARGWLADGRDGKSERATCAIIPRNMLWVRMAWKNERHVEEINEMLLCLNFKIQLNSTNRVRHKILWGAVNNTRIKQTFSAPEKQQHSSHSLREWERES